jgi:hypothetical protein
MAVNPIDLQVNFNQMNQVTKQQTLSKETEILKQDQATLLIQKEGDKNSKDVPETKELKDGPGKIKDEEKKNQLRKKKNKEKNQSKGDEDNEEDNKSNDDKVNKYKDPELGSKIDIIG